jgi:hypothetical protein
VINAKGNEISFDTESEEEIDAELIKINKMMKHTRELEN